MGGSELSYIQKAFDDNFIVPLGPNVNDFENKMVQYLEDEGLFAVAMSSGTAAIHIALRLLGVNPGDEIFCSSATFIATANPILYEKAVPVFIDSEDKTWNICPKSLLKAIQTKKQQNKKIPKVLIVADLFGMPANYPELLKICAEYDIALIEDAAEALGSKHTNKKCGTFGKFGILSFNGNKIITTSGGGMLLTHSKKEAEKALFLITQARDSAPYYLHSELGFNYRMSNICAGIGLGQLEVIEERVQTRRDHYFSYRHDLKNSFLTFTDADVGYFSNYWLSTALISSESKITPDILKSHLEKFNVESRHIWKPLHTQPIFKACEFFSIYDKPVSEFIFERGICLPSGSNMSVETREKICKIISLLT